MHLKSKNGKDLMKLSQQERVELIKKANLGVRYINSLPRNRKIAKSRMLQIFKQNHTTEKEVQLGRHVEGGEANIPKGEEFAQKQKNKEKNFSGNFVEKTGCYRLKIPHKKCNVCGYGFEKRNCKTKECNCCACSDPYFDLGACCEYYNNFTEHNTLP